MKLYIYVCVYNEFLCVLKCIKDRSKNTRYFFKNIYIKLKQKELILIVKLIKYSYENWNVFRIKHFVLLYARSLIIARCYTIETIAYLCVCITYLIFTVKKIICEKISKFILIKQCSMPWNDEHLSSKKSTFITWTIIFTLVLLKITMALTINCIYQVLLLQCNLWCNYRH